MKRLILVTNDDGITANGIEALIEVAKNFGDVVVVAPNSPQSAKGHAITISQPLRLSKVHIFDGVLSAHDCSGTPVDCVKLAVDQVLHRKPDLCLSGINHGSNVATNVLYSGTMSAAMEAAMEGVPSIGFSLLNYSSNADMTAAKHFAHKIVEKVLTKGMANCNLLNVNIPDLPIDQIKGIKVCKQSEAYWKENYSVRNDPMGRKYYWLTGELVDLEQSKLGDVYATNQGYVSVVPIQHDLTAYDDIDRLNKLW